MVSIKQINNKIYQIKVIDSEARDFHGCLYPVLHGTSYNCYLVVDDQITLIDVVDAIYFKDVYKAIKGIIGELPIEHIIINHTEPDHSGGYEMLKEIYPNALTYTSTAGLKAMQHQFFGSHQYIKVTKNDQLCTGDYTFSFFETPFVHWPDNMWTYLACEQYLFCNDAFGQLIVDDVLYDHEVGKEKVLAFSREYYANILWPCNNSVKKTMTEFLDLKWPVKALFPSHGVAISHYVNDLLNQYLQFTKNEPIKKAVIVYETIWSNSLKMANFYKDALLRKGYQVEMYQLSKSRISEVMDQIIDAQLLVVGSGNHNNCLLPPVADFLERLKASKFSGRKALVFGSYGWAKLHLKSLVERLEDAKFDVLDDPYFVNYVLDDQASTLLEAYLDKLEI